MQAIACGCWRITRTCAGQDAVTVAAAILSFIVVTIACGIIGKPFGWVEGIALGAAISVAFCVGQAILGVLTPAPTVDGRAIYRRPLLLDALCPLYIAAPTMFFAVKVLAGRS